MSEGKIYEAISNVMKDVGAVGKNKVNQMQRYNFRGIDDVMNALNPAMIKNHVFVAPTVLEEKREERETAKGGLLIYSVLKVQYKFYTDDGSSIECTVIGEAMDSGDKSMNKAMSAAFKYACFQVFCIPTEEMHDSEEDSPEPQKKSSSKQQNHTPSQPPQQEPVKSDEVKNAEMIANTDQDLVPHGEGMTPKRIARLKKAQEITGKNDATVLATAKAKTFEEITEANYIAVMNLFLKLMTPEQKKEIEAI